MSFRIFPRKIANWLARDASESRQLGETRNVTSQYILIGGMALGFSLVFIPVYVGQILPWDGFRPNLQIKKSDWKVFIESRRSPDCGEVATGDCPANPSDPTLWTHALSRASTGHDQRMRDQRGKEFWLGVTIPVETLLQAARTRANHLLIGRFNASYRIWVDGLLLTSGIGRAEAVPIILPIPLERLFEPRPLKVAILVSHDVGHSIPDLLNSSAGGEGFVTHSGANLFKDFISFWAMTRPLAYFLAYGILALLFFYLWASAPKEQEYYFMALYLLVTAFYQLRLVTMLNVTRNTELHYTMGILFEFYQGAFAMCLGFSFARLRRSVFEFVLPVCVAVPLVLAFLQPDAVAKHEIYNYLRKWFVPPLYSLGTLACFLQAGYLMSVRKEGSYLPTRIVRLVAFGAVLLAMCVFYIYYGFTFKKTPSATLETIWIGTEQLVLIFLLSFIAVREYRQQALLINRTPVSEYHQRNPLPEKVSGILLVADLKCSEPFYRQRAEQNSENLVSIWRSHIYTSVSKFGGIIVHKKGDEVAVLFDDAIRPNALLDAVNAAREMAQTSNLLEQEFAEQHLMPEKAEGFHFRAAVTPAVLKPMWEKMGTSREPAWSEPPGGSTFKNIGELLKLERGVPGNRARSLVMLPKALAARLPSRNITLNSDAAVYDPEAA